MTRKKIALHLCASLALLLCPMPGSSQTRITGHAKDYSVTITKGDLRADYLPNFTVIFSEKDPHLLVPRAAADPSKLKLNANPEAYTLPKWKKEGTLQDATDNIYDAGIVTHILANGMRPENGGVRWSFPANENFSLSASLLPNGTAPILTFTFTAKREGWYSIGYTGGPVFDPASADEFLQPLIWQEKRFPRSTLLTLEAMGGLPVTMVTMKGVTYGLAVSPEESPFRLPTVKNSRFGVMLRNPEGKAQPAVFAPVLGGDGSLMRAGSTFSFRMRPMMERGDVYNAYKKMAVALYGFDDARRNADFSLNDTIDNMIDFAMDDQYSGWDADLRGFDYTTDVKDTVKVVSALHPLSLAIIRDDPEIYRRRALPVTEYLMSRTKYLYNSDPNIHGQNAARDMKGPAAEASELAGISHFFHGRAPVFDSYAASMASKPRALNLLMISNGENFWTKLALYRLTNKPELLVQARRLADEYVAQRIDHAQTDFSDVHIDTGGQFWSDFAPRWQELFEMWQETNDKRYLDAAAKGAHEYAEYAWLFPSIPQKPIVVDKDGAPLERDNDKRARMQTPPQTVAPWEVSQIGLIPEASTTWTLNPAVFLAHHAAYFLRIAAATHDSFLHDLGRAAIVGRYANYPGYDINQAFTQVYARSDYPLRPFRSLTYNQVYYNHVWPQIALLTDYLVSDVETRSGGAIRFPSRFAQGYAYLKSKVYGDRPGEFLGATNVRLWMPRKVVRISNKQINYLSAYGNGNLYLALTNESPAPQSATLTLDRERVPYVPGVAYKTKVWENGHFVADTTVVDGKISLTVPANGIKALVISGMPIFTRLQGDYFSAASANVDAKSYRTDTTAVGTVNAMLLPFAGRREFYCWTSASDADVKQAELILNGNEKDKIVDGRHPFEFSVPLKNSEPVHYEVRFTRMDGSTVTSGPLSVE